MRCTWRWLMPVLLLAQGAFGQNLVEVRGRVVDEQGRPVAGADVSYYWSANAPLTDGQGKPIDFTDREATKKLWQRVGQMEPQAPESVKTDADGQFTTKVPPMYYQFLAMDSTRTRGGWISVPKNNKDPLEIRLAPLVRVHGRFVGPNDDEQPPWTFVYVMGAEDETRPLDMTRIVGCGSSEAKFAFALPPGRYSLQGYNSDLTGMLNPDPTIIVPSDVKELDLGALRLDLKSKRVSIGDWMRKKKAEGTYGDLPKLVGKTMPAWHIVDARGLAKTAQVNDFRGKWLLVDFWAVNCSICLRTELPKLARFYEEHKDQRDQFEIVAICVDVSEKLNNLDEVDQAIAPVVKHVWNGKPLPFPVLLDPSSTTLDDWGVPGYDLLLIDPEGKVVAGNEETLAEKLK